MNNDVLLYTIAIIGVIISIINTKKTYEGIIIPPPDNNNIIIPHTTSSSLLLNYYKLHGIF